MVLVCAIAALVVFVVVDLVLRRKGLGQFPLFAFDANCLYRMKPSPRGCFLNRYNWAYDANGMRHDGKLADFADATLLLGDSVVDGGAYLSQAQTMAARGSTACGETVYPIACTGWTLANALNALESIPGWQRAKRL